MQMFLSMLLALVLVGCSDDATPPDFGYPLDDELRFNHIQMKGTHNSYHVEPPNAIEFYRYTHAPLYEQAATQGVRQFELDVHIPEGGGPLEVYHVPFIDEVSTCPLFRDCLLQLKGWSDAHPGHHPIVVMIEPKDDIDKEKFAGRVTAIDEEILAIWPRERLLVPDDVRRDGLTLAESVEQFGWPTLGEVRGRAVFVLLDSGDAREEYTNQGETLEGRVMFANYLPPHPLAAIMLMDKPIERHTEIQATVAKNYIVRTRADADSGGEDFDPARPVSALTSGAQMLSTDFPVPGMRDDGYWLELTGGTPSRCNPVVAPPSCTPEAIESPQRLRPRD